MDWCGFYVLPAAVDLRSFLEANPTNEPGSVEVYSFKPFDTYACYNLAHLSIDVKSDLSYIGGVLKAMIMKNPNKALENGLKLRFMKAEDVKRLIGDDGLADLPVKKGLSSSAAISVAIAAAIEMILKNPSSFKEAEDLLSREENLSRYASLAYTGERKILGIECGQMDQFASAYGGMLFIDCRFEPAKVERLNPKAEIPIVIGDTRQGKDTPRILAWLNKRFKLRESEFIEGVRGIVDIVLEAKGELSKDKPDLYKIGELMNINQQHLARNIKVSGDCPISPSNLDALINAAIRAGALGAKLSGSGGGGCMVALCLLGDEVRVAKAIEEAGGKAYITRMANRGLRLEFFY
jgi:mevalonate kinase